MRLLDCFAETLANCLETVVKIQQTESFTNDQVRLQIEKNLARGMQQAKLAGYSVPQFDLAKFAVVTLLDEKFLGLDWPGKSEWQKELLQQKHFQTANGGTEFFDRLDLLSPLDPSESDVREVFYACLRLGFKGRYYLTGDGARLAEIIKSNYNMLAGSHSSGNGEPVKEFMEQAYFNCDRQHAITKKRNWEPVIPGLMVLGVIVLFFVLKAEILKAANYLVSVL